MSLNMFSFPAEDWPEWWDLKALGCLSLVLACLATKLKPDYSSKSAVTSGSRLLPTGITSGLQPFPPSWVS